MQKIEYMNTRKTALENMTTEQLAIAIGEYYDTHATMPGDKPFKKAAERLVTELAKDPSYEVSPEERASLIERFVDVTVREMDVKSLKVSNVNKANKDDFAVLKPTDLNLTETGREEGEGQKPSKVFFETDARIVGGKVMVGDYEIGALGKGFAVNNPNTDVPATLIATDYSNGKMANMSYRVVADLAA